MLTFILYTLCFLGGCIVGVMYSGRAIGIVGKLEGTIVTKFDAIHARLKAIEDAIRGK